MALVVVLAAYTLWRGFTLEVDYYDGYRYLANARRLLGDDQVSFDKIRPPLLALLQAPVVAIARIGGPANPALVHGPHLLSALLSLLTALALFYLFEQPCGRRIALLGTLLFMTTRYFVRYGAHVMTDLVTAGAGAAAVGWWTRARESQSLPSYVLCGAALGCAMAIKFSSNEARYLLPALPPFIYFAIRAVESADAFASTGRPAASAALSLLVGFAVLGSVANGLAQAWSDQDPVFRRDVQRRAAALAAASLRDNGQLWILGKRHTLSAQEPGPVAQDEFWNTFHYERHVAEYFLGRSLRALPVPNGTAPAVIPRLAAWVADGDAILRLDDLNYYTRAFPPGLIPRPLEVWSVRRMDLHGTADAPEMLVDGRGASVRVENGPGVGELLFTADRSLGDFSAFVVMADGAEPRFVGSVRLSAGVPTSVLATSGMPSSLVLVRVDVQKVGL